MEIRKGRLDDADELVRLEQLFNLEHNKYELPVFHITGFTIEKLKANFIKKLKKKKNLFLVADTGKKLCGYLYAEISGNKIQSYGYEDSKTPFIYLENVFIEKKYRGKGVFKQFWSLFLQYMKKNNIKYSKLHVNAHNKSAIAVYKHLGYESDEYQMCMKL